MNWKDQVDRAVNALRDVAESEPVKDIVAKAQETATKLVGKARDGALDAAQAFVQANSDPSALKLQHLNADVSIVSPSDSVEINRPSGGTLVISDGSGNGIVINAAADKAYVTETIGIVNRVNANTYDLGAEDGINVVVVKV
jgi:hypothetical protein